MQRRTYEAEGVCHGQEHGLLVGLAEACRRGLAGAAWLLDYTVAVVLSAWDGVSVPRPSRTPRPQQSRVALSEPDAPGVLFRPGKRTTSLALIGVASISIAGAWWSGPSANDTPASVLEVPAPAESQEAVLLWAPIVEDDTPAPHDTPLTADPTAEPTAEPTEPPAPPEPDAARAAEPASPPLAAAAVETPAPAETSAPPPPAETPVPAPTPAPAASAVGGQLSKATIREVALQVGWPEAEVDELLAVAWCESRFRVEANGWGALGLMQIMPFWFESLGIDVALAFDPATNLKVAYHIYQNDLKNGYDEWASWTCKPVGLPAHAP